MRRVLASLAAGAAVLLLAGCAETAPGEAAPRSLMANGSGSPSGSPSSEGVGETPGLPHSGAPPVATPLPDLIVEGDPCRAMTRAQVEQMLGADAPEGERTDNQAGPNCDWDDRKSGAGFRVGFSTGTGEGLSSYYANTQPQVQVWRELSAIGGFPAVEFMGLEQQSTCSVVVGISNKYAVHVAGNAGRGQEEEADHCQLVKQLAGMTVATLKQKAGR